MTLFAPRWTAALAATVALGCGGEDPATTGGSRGKDPVAQVETQLQHAQSQVAETRERVAARTEADTDPCTVLTEAIIRRELSVEESAAIDTRRGQAARNLCTHTWQDPSFDQEQHTRRMMKQMMKAMRKGGTAQGMIELAAQARSGFEVTYTHGPTAESPEAARRFFEQAMARMQKGISQQIDRGPAKGREVTFQMTTEPVAGVGDLARWSSRMSQLGVVHGSQVFYVTAQVSNDAPENLAAARKLALAIIRS